MSVILEREMDESWEKPKPMTELNKLSSDTDIYGGRDLSHGQESLPAAAETGRDSGCHHTSRTETCAAASMGSTVASACHACVHVGVYTHQALKFIPLSF